MPNITFSIDEDIIKKVRKIAVEKETTLTAMVRNYLTSVAQRNDLENEAVIMKLKGSFKKLGRDMGPRKWTRESVYER